MELLYLFIFLFILFNIGDVLEGLWGLFVGIVGVGFVALIGFIGFMVWTFNLVFIDFPESVRKAVRGDIDRKRLEAALGMGLKWTEGRQGTGYQRLTLVSPEAGLPFDLYVLRYPLCSHIPPHRDPVPGRKHYRLNIELIRPTKGGCFRCSNVIWKIGRVVLFRPDKEEHEVTQTLCGQRIVLSVGWAILDRK